MTSLRIAWFCGLPREVQQSAFASWELGAFHNWSWIVGHLPPPAGIELHVVCPSRHIREFLHAQYRGAHFHLMPVLRGGVYTFYSDWIRRYRQFARELDPDCIHGWGVESGFGISAVKASRRHIVGIQGLLSQCLPYSDKDKRRVGFWLGVLNERRTLREAGLIVAESEYSKRATSLYSKACITVVPQPLRDVFVSTRPGHRDQKTVVFVGAHIKRKGFIDALRAFSMLGQDDWTLICIGSMSPANRKLALELVNNLGISRQVQLLGPRPAEDIVRYLKHSPVFLLPSYIDTGPNALKEALAMGVWPVCYDNSGPKEFVSKYRFGSLSKTGDINALAASLRDALTTQPWRDSTRALECADAIRRDLDRERIWEQLTKLYRERSAAG